MKDILGPRFVNESLETESDERMFSDEETPSSSDDQSRTDEKKLTNWSRILLNQDRILGKDCLLYRAEGNSSVVIALRKEKKVIRLLKHEKDNIMGKREIEEKLVKNINFCDKILKKLLNPNLFDVPTLVALEKKSLSKINTLLNKVRLYLSSHRLNKVIPEKDTYALLLDDYCSLPKNQFSLDNRLVGPLISVEIKPKQGFIINNLHMHSILPTYCRYSLAQCWKLKSGQIQEKSDYCPLDLFSGCPNRMAVAINRLIENPQNNFRIFQDLHFAFGDDLNSKSISIILDDFFHGTSLTVDQQKFCFIDLLVKALLMPFHNKSNNISNDNININDNNNKLVKIEDCDKFKCQKFCQYHPVLCQRCDHCYGSGLNLPQNSVLDSILSLQRLDTIGSTTVLKYYLNLQKFRPDLLKELDKLKLPNGIGEMSKQSYETEWDYLYRKLWEYLVSMTAKDCSVLITLQRIKNSEEEDGKMRKECDMSDCHHIISDMSGIRYYLSVSITDLDQKNPHKIFKTHKNELVAADLI